MHRIPDTARLAPPDSTANQVSHSHVPQNDYDGTGASDYLQIRDYWFIVYRRRWIVLAIVVAGLLTGVVVNWRATRIFEASAMLQIEADPNVLGLERPLVDQRDWMREFLPTQLVILESRELAGMAREELMRADHPAGAPTDSVTRTESSAPHNTDAQDVASVGEILGGRSVSPVYNTRLVNITFRSTDPAKAAAVANALASAFVRWNFEFKKSTTGAASDWLAEQVTDQRRRVQESELALQRYREQYGADALRTLPTISNAAIGERQNIVIQKLVELQSASTFARAQTIEKEMQYRMLSTLQEKGEPVDTLPAIASSPFIHGLKAEVAGLRQQLSQASAQLGERHPEIIRLRGAVEDAQQKLQLEISKQVAAIRNEYEVARAREQATAAALEGQKEEVSSLNAKAVEYTALEGEARANRALLDNLVQRSRQIALARDLPSGNATILDAAQIPGEPILPRERRNMLFSLVGSGALSLALVFLLEIFDTRITSPLDVRRYLRIPLLGVVPQVKSLNGKASLLLTDGVPSHFGELLRGVRTNLLAVPDLAIAPTLLVTSAEPGEGKTLTAANLATSLAQLKQRVLLIDADMRQPRLHDIFGEKLQPGLTDVMKGASPSSAFRRTKVAGMWLLPAGSSSRNPADLLGSEPFSKFIDMLRTQFDWVLIDSPPVLAVTDACLIARVTSGVVLVVGGGQTPRAVAGAAVARLEAAGGNIVGALLNRVVLNRRGESYLPYYHRDYQGYYPQHDDSPWLPQPLDVPPAVDSTRSS